MEMLETNLFNIKWLKDFHSGNLGIALNYYAVKLHLSCVVSGSCKVGQFGGRWGGL